MSTTENVIVDVAVAQFHDRIDGVGRIDEVGSVRTILGQIAGTVDVVDIKQTAGISRVDDDGDVALDVAVLVATAEHRADVTATDNNSDIAAGACQCRVCGVTHVGADFLFIYFFCQRSCIVFCQLGLRGVFPDVGGVVVGTQRTAEYRAESAAIDDESQIAVNGTQSATAIHSQIGLIIGTRHFERVVADDVGKVAAEEEVVNHQRSAITTTFDGCDISVTAQHGTLTVAGAENVTDVATLGFEVHFACTDVGCLHGAVAAAENLVVTAAVDDEMSAYGVSSIAATEDFLDGITTTMHMHVG